jgi:uncharacterized membrane protein
MRPSVIVGPILLGAGAILIAVAALTGGAHAVLVLIFPVVYGDAPLFVLGILLIVTGVFALPFAFGAGTSREPAAAPTGPVTSGGVVLVGPIPIFWGSASGASRRVRIATAIGGTAALIVAVALFVWWFR